VDRFLIVRTSALGDIVHGMPVAAALKEKYPRCRIAWVVDERYQDLLAGHPWVDRILLVRFKEGLRTLRDARGRKNWIGLARTLRDLRFDVAIDLQGLFRSGCISYLSRAPIRIGFPRGHVRETLNRVFSNVRPRSIPPRSHVIDRNLALLHPLGIHTRERRFLFRVSPSVQDSIGRYLRAADEDDQRLRVVVHPAAGWITKQWDPKHYAEIADRILEAWDARVFLLWGPGERELAQQVRGAMRRPGHLVPDMGLSELVAFLGACGLFIGGDSGPLHLASALGVPVLGLYGPSDSVRNGPLQGADQVVTASPPCGPCYKRDCTRSSCMDSISVEQVWATLVRMIEDFPARAREEERIYTNESMG
jgi:lipopolysaccharide heptosyltransferase I